MLIHKESIKNNYNYKGKTKMENINASSRPHPAEEE